jgi:uncharacterized GH25 family protein
MRNRAFLAVIVAALAGIPLSAHDFWLAAANWTPAAGAPVTITAGLGERFPTRTGFKPRPDWFDQWRLIGASGDVPVTPSFDWSDSMMITEVKLPGPGAYLGVMRVTPNIERMKGDEFTAYLKEEGLHRIITARQVAGDADKPATELYARYAKIAVRTGAGSGAHLTRPAGVKAEFVPAADPTSLHPGGSLSLQFLVDGKPVSGAAVSAVAEGTSVTGETDADGRVTLKIDREGAWLIRTVHMVPLTGSPDVDWESYWVTLSFHTAAH